MGVGLLLGLKGRAMTVEKARMLEKSFWLMASVNKKRGYSRELSLPRVGAKNTAKSGEVAIQVTLSLPETLFTKPQLRATIGVDQSQISSAVVDAEVANNIADLVAENLGIQLTIECEPKGDE